MDRGNIIQYTHRHGRVQQYVPHHVWQLDILVILVILAILVNCLLSRTGCRRGGHGVRIGITPSSVRPSPRHFFSLQQLGPSQDQATYMSAEFQRNPLQGSQVQPTRKQHPGRKRVPQVSSFPPPPHNRDCMILSESCAVLCCAVVNKGPRFVHRGGGGPWKEAGWGQVAKQCLSPHTIQPGSSPFLGLHVAPGWPALCALMPGHVTPRWGNSRLPISKVPSRFCGEK